MPISYERLETAPARATRAVFAATIFLSAFLLFLVQPLIARRILPWFGGATAVWTTCMLFFQVLLLGGYYYAHRITAIGRGGSIHAALLGGSLLLVPLLWIVRSPIGSDPTLSVLLLLALTTGAPYLLLSTTGPAVQAWFGRLYPDSTPYHLYALSNLGSMLALLAYPVLIEPWIGVERQMYGWAAGYVIFAGLCAWTARQAGTVPLGTDVPRPATPATDKTRNWWWLILPACSSALLLAVTNHLTQNIAPVPFLWILPLTVYLISFILCFDRRSWYRSRLFQPLAIVALAAMAGLLAYPNLLWSVKVSIPALTGCLFIICMFLHGEVSRLKPAPERLTAFYLALSLGGALGALTVAVGAPHLLKGIFELPLALVLCGVAGLFLKYGEEGFGGLLWVILLIWLTANAVLQINSLSGGNRAMVRNFYGALRVRDVDGARLMVHGTINHGMQSLKPELRDEPTAYYGRTAGIGMLVSSRPASRVAIIGLGAGTLASYSRPGDVYRFYELNPAVAELARQQFTFLDQAKGKVEIALGDGRLLLEREASQAADVLVVDAFSGDSIPVHLLTKEAVAVYQKHLKRDGILALHVSNVSLDLVPVVAALARQSGRTAYIYEDPGDPARLTLRSTWTFIPMGAVTPPGNPISSPQKEVPVWTDDYSNLFRILRF